MKIIFQTLNWIQEQCFDENYATWQKFSFSVLIFCDEYECPRFFVLLEFIVKNTDAFVLVGYPVTNIDAIDPDLTTDITYTITGNLTFRGTYYMLPESTGNTGIPRYQVSIIEFCLYFFIEK